MDKSYFIIFILLLLSTTAYSQKKPNIERKELVGIVKDNETLEPLSFVTIQLLDSIGNYNGGTLTADDGTFTIQLSQAKSIISASYIGYSSKKINIDSNNLQKIYTIYLTPDPVILNEVVVTAQESKGTITSTSKIDRSAMQHIQPTSFSDLLSLLPGGATTVPVMTSANVIALREAGTSNSDYNTSSLGTSFIVDGTVINNDANLQSIEQGGSTKDGSRDHKNAGLDMRSLSTDNIEEVEIIRGIPSAAYGDITSGAVIIKRRLTSTPLQARFKSDQYGKLFFIGKGLGWKEKEINLNIDLDYLDSKADPRNLMENYKRINASLRFGKIWQNEETRIDWRVNFDIRTSIDDDKNDPNITTMQEDKYKKTNRQYTLSNRFSYWLPKKFFIKKFDFNASLSLSTDKIVQSRFIQLDRDRVTPNYMQEGEFDGVFLPYKYTAHLIVDGKPVNASLSGSFSGNGKWKNISHHFSSGINYRYDKNFGDGQMYDLSRPLNTVNSTRPRAYKDIPAIQELSAYAEEQLQGKFGKNTIKFVAGARATTIPGLSSKYSMAGKIYIDPRINIQWQLPVFNVSDKPFCVDVSGGLGRLTKKPTLSYLYPNNYYVDLVQLNYYNSNSNYKRIFLKTYIVDPTNYNLNVARNNKWEIRLGMNYNDNSLSVTYFKEKMNSGYRYTTMVQPYSFKKYDTSPLVGAVLQAPPSLENLTYKKDTILGTYYMITNGSRIDKEGVEFQLSTRRLKKIKTRLTVYGAWFKTIYSNSQEEFDASVTKVLDNVPVNDKYIGLYDWNDGYIVQNFNTNFLFDTYIKSLGLTFSTSFECNWFNSRQTMKKNGIPIAYINTKGEIHPFTEEDKKDTYKQWLIKDYSNTMFAKTTEPFYMYVNLKSSKDFGKYLRISLFVDRIFDYMPSYKNNMGTLVRRSVRPYFGMEMTLKL